MGSLTLDHLRNLVVDLPISRTLLAFRRNRQVAEWKSAGKPVPPPHIVKQRIVVAYAAAFNTEVLVETGTFRGDMVYAMKDAFRSIYSIELSPDFCELARRRLRRLRHIRILAGDSGKVLPNLLDGISTRCLFWLDGHYSGGDSQRGDGDSGDEGSHGDPGRSTSRPCDPNRRCPMF